MSSASARFWSASPARWPRRTAFQTQDLSAGIGHRPRNWPENRRRPGADRPQCRADGARDARGRAGGRYDRSQLGAGDETRGGRTCHAAIIARELGVPAVVGCGNATEALNDGALVTVSCAEGDEGRIYSGALETEVSEVRHDNLPDLPVKIMMNIGNPQLAFEFCQLPNAGVGLARLEFIINHAIGVHPKAVLEYPNLKPDVKEAVERAARGYA